MDHVLFKRVPSEGVTLVIALRQGKNEFPFVLLTGNVPLDVIYKKVICTEDIFCQVLTLRSGTKTWIEA